MLKILLGKKNDAATSPTRSALRKSLPSSASTSASRQDSSGGSSDVADGVARSVPNPLAASLEAKYRCITKVSGIIPYLLEDDRVACEYVTGALQTRSAGSNAVSHIGCFRLLTGGYFRYYSQSDDTIHLSSFKRPAEIGLRSIVGSKKIEDLVWKVTSINRMFIKTSVEDRIKRQLLPTAGMSLPLTLSPMMPRSPQPARRQPIRRSASGEFIGR